MAVDEAYVDFALGRRDRRQHAAVPRQHPNLVVLRTFSKGYSLAGARLGLLFAAAPIVEELVKVKDSYNVNAMTQAIGVAALEDRSYHEQCVRQTLDQRARLERELGADSAGRGRSRRRISFCARSASGPRRCTSRSSARACWCAGGTRPELRTKIRISVGKSDENDHLLAALGASL